MSEQDAEKVCQLRSRIVQGPQRTPEGTPPALHSLRPCWTAFLSILLDVQKSRSPIVVPERGDHSGVSQLFL
jgi:hypothetical protein